MIVSVETEKGSECVYIYILKIIGNEKVGGLEKRAKRLKFSQ